MKVKMRVKTFFFVDIIFCCWIQCSRTEVFYNASTDNIKRNYVNKTNSNYNNNNNDDYNALEPSISDVKSFIMEKYGRHYRLTGDSSLDDLKSVSHDATVGKKKDKIPASSNTRSASEKTSESLENGISDVKSIIMEKYGRHYRLTGGSALATKRDRGEAVIVDVTNSSRGYNDTSSSQTSNSTITAVAPLTYDIKNATAVPVTRDTKNATVNKTLYVDKDTSSLTNKANDSNLNNNINNNINNKINNDINNGINNNINNDTNPFNNNNTNINNSTNNSTVESNPRPLYTNNTNKTTASKSDIGNVTSASQRSDLEPRDPLRIIGKNDTIINLPVTKNDTTSKPGTQEIVFGLPPQTGDKDNNITEDGNLTTITIDLTKGNTSAIIPGLDVNNSPVQSVDVLIGNKDHEQAPKRSATVKHKKHIVFQMSKPRIAITDFANKRKHVPHHRHVVHHHHKARYFSNAKHVRRHHNVKTLSENVGHRM